MTAEPARDAGDRLRESVARMLERLAGAAHRARAGGDDEAIHDLRVAVRRLDASLDLWRPLLRRGPRRRARRTLRSLRRRLGPVREAEVEAVLLRERLEDLPPEPRVAAALLLERLTRRIRRGRRRAARWCAPSRVARLRRRVTRALGHPRDGLTPEALAWARARLAAHERATREGLRAAVDDPRDDALHQARLATKRLRYALEIGIGIRLMAESGRLEWLAAIQETLGRAHDLATLAGRVRRFAARLAAVEPRVASGALDPLLGRLEAERLEALALFPARVAALAPVGAGPRRLRLATGGRRLGTDDR